MTKRKPAIPEPGLLPPDPSNPLATAQWLGVQLIRLTGEIKILRAYGRRNRLYIALDVLVTAAATVATVVAVHALGSAASANSRADSADARAAAATVAEQAQHAAQVSGCVSGNQYRLGVVASLDRLVMLLEGPHPSPAVRKAAVGYEQYVLTQNEPRNCQQVYALKPQPKETPDGAS